jgi:hypothetical protein
LRRALAAAGAPAERAVWIGPAKVWLVQTGSGCRIVSPSGTDVLTRDHTPWVAGILLGGRASTSIREAWTGALPPAARGVLEAFPSRQEKGGLAWEVPLERLPQTLVSLQKAGAPVDEYGTVGAP